MSDLFITLRLQSNLFHYVLICCTQKLEQNVSKKLIRHGTLNEENELSLC